MHSYNLELNTSPALGITRRNIINNYYTLALSLTLTHTWGAAAPPSSLTPVLSVNPL